MKEHAVAGQEENQQDDGGIWREETEAERGTARTRPQETDYLKLVIQQDHYHPCYEGIFME